MTAGSPRDKPSLSAAHVESISSGSESGGYLRGNHAATPRDDSDEITALLGPGGPRRDQGSPRKDSWVGLEDFEGFPWWKKPSVWWLLVPYALFTLAFGGSIVPKLNLIIDLICQRHFADRSAADPKFSYKPVILGSDNPQCLLPEVQRIVATFMLIYSVLIGVLSSLTAPKLGALSDRYGRKRIMVISSFGGIVGEVIIILTAKYPDVIHYKWIIVGAFFDGLAGSFTAGSVLTHSYASDCTPPSKRSVAIGYLHSCLYSGLAFGPLIAGYFVEWMGSLVSIFYVTLGCHVFFILFTYFAIPESLSKKRQHLAREKYATEQAKFGPVPAFVSSIQNYVPFGKHFTDATRSWRAANPFAPLKILYPTGPGTSQLRRNLLAMAFIDFCIVGVAMSSGPVIILYTEYMFNWGNLESSRFISLTYTVRVVILVGVFPVINYLFRTRKRQAKIRRQRMLDEAAGIPVSPAFEAKNAGADRLDIWILRTALLSDVVGVVGYIFVRRSYMFVLCAIVTAFGGLGSATISASLSKQVPADRVGQVLGAAGLLHALSRIVAPAIFNGLYAATVESFPQAIFILLSAMFALAFLASLLVRPHVFLDEDDEPVAGDAGASRPSDRNASRRDEMEDDELLGSV